MKVKSFEELEVFKRAYKISLEIHKLTLNFPKMVQYGLASQIRRASKSICANIAEGFGKASISNNEFRRFIQIAIGSADEMRVWMRYCLDLGYINKNLWLKYKQEYIEIAKMLRVAEHSISR